MSNVNIAEIVANPEAHGFRWTTWAACVGIGANKKLLRKDAPVMEHLDAEKLTATFGPGYLLASANGTSGRVRDQRVCRDSLMANLTISNDELKFKVVAAALGQRAPRTSTTVVVEKVVYVGKNGAKFETEAEAEASWEAEVEE